MIFHETMFNLSQVLDKLLISIYGNQHRKIGAYYHIWASKETILTTNSTQKSEVKAVTKKKLTMTSWLFLKKKRKIWATHRQIHLQNTLSRWQNLSWKGTHHPTAHLLAMLAENLKYIALRLFSKTHQKKDRLPAQIYKSRKTVAVHLTSLKSRITIRLQAAQRYRIEVVIAKTKSKCLLFQARIIST